MSKIFIHKKAIVETKEIGEGSRIWAFVHILKGAKIGKNANICDHVFIENEVKIGNDVTVKNGVSIWNGITIGNKVFIGPGVIFTNDRYPRSKNVNYKKEKTIIKNGASVGAGAIILAGCTVEEYAMIGAGSLVSRDVPAHALIYGNPPKVKGFICVCTRKIDFKGGKFKCQCGRKYQTINGKVTLC